MGFEQVTTVSEMVGTKVTDLIVEVMAKGELQGTDRLHLSAIEIGVKKGEGTGVVSLCEHELLLEIKNPVFTPESVSGLVRITTDSDKNRGWFYLGPKGLRSDYDNTGAHLARFSEELDRIMSSTHSARVVFTKEVEL